MKINMEWGGQGRDREINISNASVGNNDNKKKCKHKKVKARPYLEADQNWQTARKRRTTFTKMPPIGTLHVYKLCCCLRVRS